MHAVLPVLSALALVGILIRVGQYGWTVSRCWAVAYAAILALFSLGYLWGVIRYRAEWPRITAPVNVVTVCVILAVLLLQNTPVLDFRAISTKSQLARVESNEIEAAEFDFRYAMRELARPGHLVAEELVAELGFDPRQQTPTTAFVAEDGLQIEPSEGWTLHRSDAEPLRTSGGNVETFETAEQVLQLLRDPPLTLLQPRYDHVKIGDTVYGWPARDWSSD